MPHRSVWKPVTKRDTRARSLVQHRRQANEIGVRAYARKLEIKPGTLSRYLVGDWEPKDVTIRTQLGLPVMSLGIVCKTHGKVCTVQHRPPKPVARWRDLPIEELRWAIENRKDYNS